MVNLFLDMCGTEPPEWYGELWRKMGQRGMPIDQVDTSSLVTVLSDTEMRKYQQANPGDPGCESEDLQDLDVAEAVALLRDTAGRAKAWRTCSAP